MKKSEIDHVEETASSMEYRICLDLECGAKMTMLLFNEKEHRWLFEHRYIKSIQRRDPEVVNKYRLSVDYTNGKAGDLSLLMDIVFPNRRGKTFLFGVDVSDNSRLTVDFSYSPVPTSDGFIYKLKGFEIGCGKYVDLENLEAGLVRQIDFPFTVLDRIEPIGGVFKVPFLFSENEERYFVFPRTILRNGTGW